MFKKNSILIKKFEILKKYFLKILFYHFPEKEKSKKRQIIGKKFFVHTHRFSVCGQKIKIFTEKSIFKLYIETKFFSFLKHRFILKIQY
jgi:hypothetical protein